MRKRPVPDPEDVFRVKVADTMDIGLFAPMAVIADAPRVVAVTPGERARMVAKESADRTLSKRQALIVASLRGHGPQTRLTLMQTTGMAESSVNSSVNALLNLGLVEATGFDEGQGRSIVSLTHREG